MKVQECKSKGIRSDDKRNVKNSEIWIENDSDIHMKGST